MTLKNSVPPIGLKSNPCVEVPTLILNQSEKMAQATVRETEHSFSIRPETSQKKLFVIINCWGETEDYQDLPPDWPVAHAWQSSSGHPTLAFTITKIVISDFQMIGQIL
jgi:hypothetical protein